MSPLAKQSWTISGVLVSIIGQGMGNGYQSSLVPGVMAADSSIRVDLQAATWLASCVGAPMMAGMLGSSFLMECFGRRTAHALSLLPGICGWTLIFFAPNYICILVGRMLTGLSMGSSLVIGSTVAGEFSCPEYRGLFLNLKTAASTIGSTVMHLQASYLDWRTAALISCVPSVFAFFNTLTWPESPSWLISKNRFKRSERSFYWLRGRNENTVKEFEAMTRAQKERTSLVPLKVTFWQKVLMFLKKFARKDFVKPVLIVFFAFILLESSGRHIFQAYALDIVGKISDNRAQTLLFTFSIDIISTVSSCLTCIIVKMLKRRTLLFYSGITCLVILSGICIYLLLVSKGAIPPTRQWIPLVALLLYFVVANTGLTAIPLALYGEVFPLPHRGSGTGITGVVMALTITVGLKVTPIMLQSLKVHGTFTVLGAISTVSLLYLYVALPETKDRTLQEIEDYFVHGRFLDSDRNIDEEEKLEMISTPA